jgi:hypothetical protein
MPLVLSSIYDRRLASLWLLSMELHGERLWAPKNGDFIVTELRNYLSMPYILL